MADIINLAERRKAREQPLLAPAAIEVRVTLAVFSFWTSATMTAFDAIQRFHEQAIDHEE